MAYEIELKFSVSDAADLRRRIEELGARPDAPIAQCDRYFNHPGRDFRQTNEALRVRSLGDRCVVTYKGPVLDREVKTRREIELPIGTTAAEGNEFAEMLALLGFREVRSVEKVRQPFHLAWHGIPVELSIDEVSGLGTFAEIETLADDGNRQERRDAVVELASRLGLSQPEWRSYLTMLLGTGAEGQRGRGAKGEAHGGEASE